MALLLGTALSLVAMICSQLLPGLLGLALTGPTFALVGILQLLMGTGAVLFGLRLAELRLRDVGFVSLHWRSDVLIGVAIAVSFALL